MAVHLYYMDKEKIIEQLAKDIGLTVRNNQFLLTREDLAQSINELIDSDFEKLVSILYRMDVEEGKLKQMLDVNPGTDAGLIIADLMIERQLQKIKSREQFSRRDNDISDEDKW